jgi:hypothetical protein
MTDDESRKRKEFNEKYLPCFTEYFSQAQMEKKIISYVYLIE